MTSTNGPGPDKPSGRSAQQSFAAAQPSQRQRSPSPNVIRNVDMEPPVSFGPQNKFDFAAAAAQYDSVLKNKKPALKALTMAQFMRTIDSKQGLLYALRVKGKHAIIPFTVISACVPCCA